MNLRSFVWTVTFFFSYVPFIVYAWRWTDSIEIERAVFFWFMVTSILGLIGVGVTLELDERIRELRELKKKVESPGGEE